MPVTQVTRVKKTVVKTAIVKDTIVQSATLRRSKGELTREKILFSAIEVLAVNGIKGTTHRAIASYADLQLSLTTYYFKDINELIQAAFELNSQYLRSKNEPILEQAFTLLTKIDKTDLRKVSVKCELCEQLAHITANYLFSNVQNETAHLTVEQLMFTTVKMSPQLKKLANEHKQSQIIPFTTLATFFNKKDPEIDAEIMRTLFLQLQYNQLSIIECERSINPILKASKKLIGWVVGLRN